MPYLLLSIQLGLAGVFLVSSVAKLRSPADTVQMWADLLTAVRLSVAWSRWGAWALIAVEAMVSVLLLVPIWWLPPVGLWAATAMMAAFTGLAAVSARTGMDIRCACFGRATARLGWRHVWRNLALLLLALTGTVLSLWEVSPAVAPGGIAVALLASGLIAVLAAFYDDIVDLVVEM